MTEHLILRLEAPMTAFGGETIDNRGVVRDFPARSMLAGLLGNALGLDRAEGSRLDGLQERIDHAAARIDRSAERFGPARMRPGLGGRRQDYQTARLFEKDAGWTTRGRPEGRASSPSFTWDANWEAARGERAKSLTHQRYRDLDADAATWVALSLAPGAPDMDVVTLALERPERPLFIGRKPFIPSRPILTARIAAANPLEALAAALAGVPGNHLVQWQGASSHMVRTTGRGRVADLRRFAAGVHGGSREVREGVLKIAAAPA